MDTNSLMLILLAVLVVVNAIDVFARQRDRLDAVMSERMEKLLRDDTAMRLMEKAYEDAGTAQRMVINTLADVVKILAPLTPIKTDDTVDRFFDDLLKPGESDDPVVDDPVQDDPEPEPDGGALVTVNPLLLNAMDGTVDTGTDYRYQKRPLGWLVHWKKHVNHDTPPFINAVDGGFRAELAFIAGEVGYVSELTHLLAPGHYLVKAVVDADVVNPPPNSTDVSLRAALLRPDGSVFAKLPAQPFTRWKGENVYLMPIRVAAEPVELKLVFYVEMMYPTMGANSAVMFKQIALLRDDGSASDYVDV